MNKRGLKKAVLPAVLAACALLPAGGCRRARVDKPTEPVEPSVQVSQLPPPPKAAKAAPGATPAATPWHRELLTGEDARPAMVVEMPGVSSPAAEAGAKEPEAKAGAPSAEPKSAAPAYGPGPAGLLEEIRAGIETRRNLQAKWSLLRLELSAPKPRNALQLAADVGVTSLYARRAEIAFERVPIEQCLTRLAKMAGMHYAQNVRVQNPLITWRRENVTVYAAIEAILQEHGFVPRYVSAGARLTFEPGDYPSREKFVAEAIAGVLRQGEKIEKGMPAVVVAPREAPKAPPAPSTPPKAAPKSNAPAEEP
jgi:hypothetical protein